MKAIWFVLFFSFSAVAMDDSERRLQEKRVQDREQELRDAQYSGNPNKIMRKEMRLEEEKQALEELKTENPDQ